MNVQLDESWKQEIGDEFEKPYMNGLRSFLKKEKESGQAIYPPGSLIFNAFAHTPFEQVNVVILGQDPYHGAGQAQGLAFSVRKGTALPPSLKNIFKELEQEIPGFPHPAHGELTSWADQGVLLLNATLTVRAGAAGSHQHQGWEQFTDTAISKLSEKRNGIIFLLWGKFAQSKAALIDQHRHHILMAPHPSPFSAHSGFFGCNHFVKTNELLARQGKPPIDWTIR